MTQRRLFRVEKWKRVLVAIVLSGLSAGLAWPVGAEPGPLPFSPTITAMSAEIDRSMKKLRLMDYEPPYFMSARLLDVESISLMGRFGAVIQNSRDHRKYLSVEVRVGDYRLDNSMINEDFDGYGLTNFTPDMELAPLDDNPEALRGVLWMLLDARYKMAISQYLKKKAQKVYEVETPQPNDFSHEIGYQYQGVLPDLTLDLAKWQAAIRQVTGLYREYPDILGVAMEVEASRERMSFVNSEGSRIETSELLYSINIKAQAYAEDGTVIPNYSNVYFRAESQLPPTAELIQKTRTLITDLEKLKAAHMLDPSNVPAILMPDAAGVLFHEAIGHRLEGERQRREGEGETFKAKVGEKIIPDFLSVSDDPSLEVLDGIYLNGYYRYDYEGIPGQKVILIEHGILKNFLLSRTPILGFDHSNGHGRSTASQQPQGRMSNLIVKSALELPDAELKKRLMALCREQGKPFGVRITSISGGETNTATFGFQAFKGLPLMVYKVDAQTGAETLVRGVEIVGTPLISVNNIVATGQKSQVFNGFCGSESGYVSVSTIAPSLLIKQIELQRSSRQKDRPPILKAPVFDSGSPKKDSGGLGRTL